MRTVQLNIPNELDINDYEVSMIVAAQLYKNARLSAGQAAKMVGVSKRTFLELLGKYDTSIFSTSIADLHQDIENA